jgi:hypothetical protein
MIYPKEIEHIFNGNKTKNKTISAPTIIRIKKIKKTTNNSSPQHPRSQMAKKHATSALNRKKQAAMQKAQQAQKMHQERRNAIPVIETPAELEDSYPNMPQTLPFTIETPAELETPPERVQKHSLKTVDRLDPEERRIIPNRIEQIPHADRTPKAIKKNTKKHATTPSAFQDPLPTKSAKVSKNLTTSSPTNPAQVIKKKITPLAVHDPSPTKVSKKKITTLAVHDPPFMYDALQTPPDLEKAVFNQKPQKASPAAISKHPPQSVYESRLRAGAKDVAHQPWITPPEQEGLMAVPHGIANSSTSVEPGSFAFHDQSNRPDQPNHPGQPNRPDQPNHPNRPSTATQNEVWSSDVPHTPEGLPTPEVVDSVDIAVAARSSLNGLAQVFVEGDVLQINRHTRLRVRSGDIGVGPDSVRTALLTFERALILGVETAPGDRPSAEPPLFALSWGDHNHDTLTFVPVRRSDPRIAMGRESQPFESLVLLRTRPGKSKLSEALKNSAFAGTAADAGVRYVWSQLPEEERQRLIAREKNASAVRKLPRVAMTTLLWTLGVRTFEEVLRDPMSPVHYLSPTAAGPIECVNSHQDGSPGFGRCIKMLVNAGSPEDYVRTIGRYKNMGLTRFERVREYDLIGKPAEHCYTDEIFARYGESTLAMAPQLVLLGFSALASTGSEQAVKALLLSARMPSMEIGLAIWATIKPPLRQRLWMESAGQQVQISQIMHTSVNLYEGMLRRKGAELLMRLVPAWLTWSSYHQLYQALLEARGESFTPQEAGTLSFRGFCRDYINLNFIGLEHKEALSWLSLLVPGNQPEEPNTDILQQYTEEVAYE